MMRFEIASKYVCGLWLSPNFISAFGEKLEKN